MTCRGKREGLVLQKMRAGNGTGSHGDEPPRRRPSLLRLSEWPLVWPSRPSPFPVAPTVPASARPPCPSCMPGAGWPHCFALSAAKTILGTRNCRDWSGYRLGLSPRGTSVAWRAHQSWWEARRSQGAGRRAARVQCNQAAVLNKQLPTLWVSHRSCFASELSCVDPF